MFATARMVALMELAAGRILRPHLGPGEQSVGVTVDVTHSAATPEGGAVQATARYLGREGKLHLFEIVARDEGGEIGRARHRPRDRGRRPADRRRAAAQRVGDLIGFTP